MSKKRDPIITSKIMAAIPGKDTQPERILGKAMWSKGLRYRKHYKIIGKPDFVFVSKRVAVFKNLYNKSPLIYKNSLLYMKNDLILVY